MTLLRIACLLAFAGAAISAGGEIACDSWQLLNPIPTERELHGVCRADGR